MRLIRKVLGGMDGPRGATETGFLNSGRGGRGVRDSFFLMALGKMHKNEAHKHPPATRQNFGGGEFTKPLSSEKHLIRLTF